MKWLRHSVMMDGLIVRIAASNNEHKAMKDFVRGEKCDARGIQNSYRRSRYVV
jgi:hypothetical protein